MTENGEERKVGIVWPEASHDRLLQGSTSYLAQSRMATSRRPSLAWIFYVLRSLLMHFDIQFSSRVKHVDFGAIFLEEFIRTPFK